MSKKIVGEDGNVYKMKKPFYKKVWFWILMVLIVGGIAGMSGEKKDSATQKGDKTEQKASDSSAEATTHSKNEDKKGSPKTYKIGETFDVGKMTYKVVGKSTGQQVGGEYGSTAKDVFLILDVEIKNNDQKAITISDDFFKLYRGKTEYKSDSSGSIMANIGDNGDNLFYSELNPGSTASGKVVFDVTQETINDSTLELQAQTGAFGTQTGRVSLNQ